jgi:tungstate transport system permease protein
MADIIVEAFKQALNLIVNGTPEFYATIYRTIYVAGVGTLLACLWSIPIAVVLGLYSFRGKWFIKGFFNALIGIPTVALGLLLYLLLSRQGQFGFLNLLYTLNGMALGIAILVTPIIVSFTSNALGLADTQLRDLAKTLGASSLRTNLTIIRETIWSVVLSVTAAFNRGFGELGIATLVGGSVLGETRVLTTSIALETNFGAFATAMAYAIVLMAIVITLALFISIVEKIKQGEGGKLTLWKSFLGGIK